MLRAETEITNNIDIPVRPIPRPTTHGSRFNGKLLALARVQVRHDADCNVDHCGTAHVLRAQANVRRWLALEDTSNVVG